MSTKEIVRNLILLTVGVLVGAGTMWLYQRGSFDTPSDARSPASSERNGTTGRLGKDVATLPLEDVLSVYDQQPGMSVVVSATLSQVSWIVIHESRDGGLGNALGAGKFQPGKSTGDVPLLRATAPSSIYHAVIYRDDGDGVFDLKRDLLLRGTAGLVESVFSTNSGAAGR